VFCRTPSFATDSHVYASAAFQTLVVALVLLRLDYGNGVLHLPTLYADSMRLHGWSFSYVVPTYLDETGYASSLRSLCWLIKFFMELYRVTWVRSSVCPIYRIDVVSTLPLLITWSCHHSNCPLLAVEHLRLLLLRHRMLKRRTLQRHQCYPFFVKDLKTYYFVSSILSWHCSLI